MLIKVYSGAVYGIEAQTIRIECLVGPGIRYHMIGLPDPSIRESWQRIETALNSSGFRMPRQKIVVNLAPAYLRKGGSAFDLAIAVGISLASKQVRLPQAIDRILFLGELSLDGSLRPIRGALSIAQMAEASGFEVLVLPKENAMEARVVENMRVIGVNNLKKVLSLLQNEHAFSERTASDASQKGLELHSKSPTDSRDFSDVKGQHAAKRALEIAAAGGHNLLFVGPPGAGKSLLAGLLPTILPTLELEQALETTRIYSAAGILPESIPLLSQAPFRSPHSTTSLSGLIGGGHTPQPGEISLAHHGVLFLDELAEFKRSVLEGLRQPLEMQKMVISRPKTRHTFPADFILVGAMNPCPCGYLNHPSKTCHCTPRQIRQYLARISGPLMDRIDMQLEILPLSFDDLNESCGRTMNARSENSAQIAQRVQAARNVQRERYAGKSYRLNARIPMEDIQRYCVLNSECTELMHSAMSRLQFSARAYERILKVARTIADLGNQVDVAAEHLAEALQYRNLDRADWGK